MVAVAKALGGDWPPHAIIVWNGQVGDGRGGTLDFVKRLGHEGPAPSIRVIDPTPRRYAARETSEGTKKLLSLDGGGIRGVLALQILGSIEAQLRDHYGRPDTVLSDYFDYFGGTSTGAILAAALASGMHVGELQSKYRELGAIVFKQRFLPMRFRSLYRDEPLTAQLEKVIGAGRTLGGPELRSLLLVVMHNTKTDSPWPLSSWL